MKQIANVEAGLGQQIRQLTFMADYLPEAKRGPFLGRLRSFSSLGATQRQAMVDYLVEALTASGKLAEALSAWDRSQAEGSHTPLVEQTAQIARDKVVAATAALKAANKINKLSKLILALARLAAIADCETIDELVTLSNAELTGLVGQLGSDDYAALAPFLSLPKRV